MSDAIRFAVVGLGMGRGRSNICANTPGAELAVVCDVWDERIKQVTDTLDVEVERDYERLLKRSDIDVIGLWTPSGMHGEMAVQALEAGKHVCTTKPMDIRTDVCDKAIKLAEEKGLVLAVDFESRYRPVNHQIRNALSSGSIGRILFGDLRMKWYRSQSYYESGMPEAWRSRMATERGSLANQAVHYLDLLQWWIGPVVRVVGRRQTLGHEIQTEDGTVAILELAGGANAIILTTTCSFPNIGSSIQISGSKGSLFWKDQEIELFKAVDPDSIGGEADNAYVLPQEWGKPEAMDLRLGDFDYPEDLPANIFEDMVRAIRDGKPVACDGKEGRKTVAIFEAVYASSDDDAWKGVREY